MPLVFWFSVVLLSVFLRNEEGDINTHKQTHILGDAYLSWPWGAGWPIWSSSWGAGVLCCAVSAWAVLQVTNPRSYHDKLCTLTWVCSCPLQAWPKPSLALLSSHCLLCSPGPLSSPSHVPCGSWPAEECHVLLTGHSPSCPGQQLGVLLQELTLPPQLFEPYPLLPKHSFTKRSQNYTSHAE